MPVFQAKDEVIKEINQQQSIVGKVKVIIKDYDTNISNTPPGAVIDTQDMKAYIKVYYDKGYFKKEQEEREKKQVENRASNKTTTTDTRDVAIHSFDGLLGTWRKKGYVILKDNANYLSDIKDISISKIIDGSVEPIKKEKERLDHTEGAIEKRIEEFLHNGVKQIVLTGAPGTGKTYTARKIAIKLILGDKYDKYLNMNDKQRKDVEELLNCNDIGNKKFDSEVLDNFKEFAGQMGFVQFHPSYDYTDFVEGIRPKKDMEQGGIGFEYKPGIFMEFCNKAATSFKKHIFIIDEINRADLSKVFGELMFGLESNYRGKIIKTQYENLRDNGKEFFIPEEVYIIGTMNDIDRSVSTFDFALRRRFAWIEIKAEDIMGDALKAMLPEYSHLDNLIDDAIKLNSIISDQGRDFGLSDSYHLGHAYFSKIDASLDYVEAKEKLWNYYLEPILKEYVRGYDSEKIKEFISRCNNVFI